MSSVIYAIVFKGEILDGFQPISVKAHMAKLLRADADKMKALFSGKQIVIKRTPDKQEAAKYTNALKKVGADIKVRAIKSDAPAPAPASAPASASTPASPEPAQPDVSDTTAPSAPSAPSTALSLAPNEGNIVEPSAPPPPPEIDLSGIELSPDNDLPLTEPKVEEVVELDLSEFSIKENDGTPLVETEAEAVPEIAVPDFGLDEPGAILETIQEEKDLLNPNTMGMTLAMAGSELLEPDEKDEAAPPPPPDISKIHLVPSFDT